MANNSGVCRLQDDASEHQRYVAQILDPLYYNFTDNLSSARTLGTYACMPTRITPWRRQRTKYSMPAYYGSRAFEMSLDLPEPDGRKIRHVRMVRISL
ncbi:hypothetical protein MCOR14_005039 [Pyricularia oryzae]|nr:hypothetical protein MCOR15_005561 [Pyricularia oryzae]KAI6534641.1 hypothetical protein MCOR16_003064 [Pyricularia oryzae]KAI6636890.1 hypothetical protein MCOR14_005039 [Pyricularia oryzae]KAI6642630.1 hypothetical protein MCOR08_000402 [Pyricularia oryzae]